MATTRKTPAARPVSKVSDQPTSKPKSLMSDDELTDAEKARDAAREADELLADMPKLKRPEKLRIRERNQLMKLVIQSDLLDGLDGGVIDAENIDNDQMVKMLDLVAAVDDFAESIADDPEKYAKWSEGKDFDVFMAIMNRYTVTLGK